MSASKFLIWLTLSFASVVAIALGLFCLHLGQPWWPHHHNREVRIAKHHIAESVQGPAIWLQGGSSTWFGFDSPQLSSAIGYDTSHHLTSDGARKRTETLIPFLKQAL